MTSTYTGTPSDTAPYLEIMRKDFPTKPGYPIAIYPKLAGRPAKMKFSDDLSVMALVSYLRRENMAGIGNPTETPPTSGIRVFNYNDRFLFLGGNSSQPPILYERAGPVYQNTNLLAMPSGQYAIAAAFSRGGKYLFVVWSGTPNRVDVYSWTGTDAKDPAGAWAAHSTLNQSGAVQTLYVSAGNKYLVASQSAAMAVYTIEPLAPVYTASSRFLDMNKAETKFAALNSGGSVEIRAAPDGAVQQTLGGATWNNLNSGGVFDVDSDDCFVMVGRAATGSASPITYVFDTAQSQWVFSYGESRASLTGLNLRNLDAVPGKIAAGLSTSAEIYKKQDVSPAPLTPMTSPYAGVSATVTATDSSTDGTIIALLVASGTSLLYRRSGDTLTPITGLPTATLTDICVSPDGQFVGVLLPGTSGSVYTISGNTLTNQVALPDNGTSGIFYGIAISEGGTNIAVSRRLSGSSARAVGFYSRSGGTIAAPQIVQFSADTTYPVQYRKFAWKPGTTNVVCLKTFQTNSNFPPIIFEKTGSTWAVASVVLPTVTNFAQGYAGGSFSVDGHFAYTIRGSSTNSWKLMIVDSSYDIVYESPAFTTNGAPYDMTWSPGSEGIAIGLTSSTTAQGLRVFGKNSQGWSEQNVPGLTSTSSGGRPVWMAERLDLISSTIRLSWEWSRMKSYPGYVLDVTQAFANATRVEFSPLGEILHMNDAATNIHRRMATGATIPALAFVPDFPASQVSNVQYSPTGKVVIANSPDGLELAVSQSGGGDFLNSKNVSGTFVSLYDLNESARRFTERGFVSHVSGSNVFDIVFSPEMNVFTYHVILGETGVPTSNQGRILYDITGEGDAARYDYRGYIWDPDLLRTFIAFSPDEDYFALTEERDTGLNDILLGKFAANFFYTIEDTKPVAFGPPAFSHCDDVVVAHGGTPPFSFFKHVKATEDLVPRAMDVIDWTNTGIVLDVKWNATCTGLVLITKDRIISIEIDNGTDEATVDQDVPLDEEIPDGEEDDVTIRWPSDTDDIEIVPGMPTPGFPGSYSPPDDGIAGISYVPYSVVTVSFRVTPVAR